MNPAQKIVDTHLLKTFFHINLIEQGTGKVTLKLTSKGMAEGQLAILGCIFDYAARIAGYKTLEQSFISECEINVHHELQVDNLTVNASIVSASKQYATYHCEIYSINPSSNLLLAESQGTLQRVALQKMALQTVHLLKAPEKNANPTLARVV